MVSTETNKKITYYILKRSMLLVDPLVLMGTE